MQVVKGGIDKLFVTFSDSIPIATLVEKLFLRLSLRRFKRHDKCDCKYYQMRHSLKAGGHTLVNIYSLPKHSDRKLYRNSRNLIAINGLAFSDSALNGLKPHKNYPNDSALDLQHLCNAIIELGGHITQIDGYLDDIGGNYLDEEHLIYTLSRPRSFKLNIRSNLIKDVKGEATPPRPNNDNGGRGCYYGRKHYTQALLYRKDLCPYQLIYNKHNPVKYKIVRFELRFRKDQARKVGKEIVEAISNLGYGNFDGGPDYKSVTQIMADVISQHFAFIIPTKTNKHRAGLEPNWKRFIDAGLAATTDTAEVTK